MSSKRLTAAITSISLFAVLVCADAARALDAFWCGPRSELWHDGIAGGTSNWFSLPPTDPSAVVRNVPDGIATFAPGAVRTNVRITQSASIGRMRFTEDAPLYTFLIERRLSLNGLGLRNHSAETPRFTVLGLGEMRLTGSASLVSAGGATSAQITTYEGRLRFVDMSRGGDAQVLNSGGGTTWFEDLSSAEAMTITNSGLGFTLFDGRSTGDRAHIINKPAGRLVSLVSELPIGKVDNDGVVDLGPTKLMVRRSYDQSPSGTLWLYVSGPTNFGAVIAKTGARLGGTLSVTLTASAVPGFVKIVQVSNGPLIGRFANVSFLGPGRLTLRGSLVYTARDVRLVLRKK